MVKKLMVEHLKASLEQRNLILQGFHRSYYLFIERKNIWPRLKEIVTHYGISESLRKLAFPYEGGDFAYEVLHNGLYHPYDDYYSHLQHFLVHLLSY